MVTVNSPSRSMETQFQPVTDPSVPAVIEAVNAGLGSYFMSPASEPNLTNPEEVQEAIRGLRVSKASGPNDIPNRAFKHLPQRAVSLLVLIFNAILLTHHFPQRGSTLEWSLYWNRGRTQHCPLLIGPLVFWTRSVSYLKRSFCPGSYMK